MARPGLMIRSLWNPLPNQPGEAEPKGLCLPGGDGATL